MKIDYLEKSTIDDIQNINFDFILFSSGYEKRARYIASNYNFQSKNKIALGFRKNKKLERENNDTLFLEKGFKIVEVADNNSFKYIYAQYKDLLSTESKKISVLVDISSMSTLMYSTLLDFFNDSTFYEEVNIYFIYVPAKIHKPQNSSSLAYNEPLSQNIGFTNRKISLILGLGLEFDKGLGLSERFQVSPEELYLFETDNEYTTRVEEINKDLISLVKANDNDGNKIIKYDVSNVEFITNSLSSLTNHLTQKGHRIIIAPAGPKIFTLISLIIGLYNENVSVYRASYGHNIEPINKHANDKNQIIVTKVVFSKEKDIH